MKVGFIGLGRMGEGVARRILAGDQELVAYDAVPGKAAQLVDAGAIVAESIAHACAGRDVVFTMLPDDPAFHDVVLGKAGIKDSLAAQAIHIALGTHSVAVISAAAAAHAAANQIFIAAPVLGRPDVAAAGQLGIIAAGPTEAMSRCTPLFGLISRRVFDVGEKQEGAAAMKLANSLLLGCAIQAMAEAFSLVRKYDVSPHTLYDVLTDGPLAAPAYMIYAKIIADESYDNVGFTALLGLKDTNLALAAADAARVPMPSVSALRDRLISVIAQGDGNKDWAILAQEQARASGLAAAIQVNRF